MFPCPARRLEAHRGMLNAHGFRAGFAAGRASFGACMACRHAPSGKAAIPWHTPLIFSKQLRPLGPCMNVHCGALVRAARQHPDRPCLACASSTRGRRRARSPAGACDPVKQRHARRAWARLQAVQAVVERAAEVRHQAGARGAALRCGLHARHLGRPAALLGPGRRAAALRRISATARRPVPPRAGLAWLAGPRPGPRRVRRRAALAGRQPRAGGAALGRLHSPAAWGWGLEASQKLSAGGCRPAGRAACCPCGAAAPKSVRTPPGRAWEVAQPSAQGGLLRRLARRRAAEPAERLQRSCAPLAGTKRAPCAASRGPASCSWRDRHRLQPAQLCTGLTGLLTAAAQASIHWQSMRARMDTRLRPAVMAGEAVQGRL
jgi:hypothetical protein